MIGNVFNSSFAARIVCSFSLVAFALVGCGKSASLADLAGSYSFSSVSCEQDGQSYQGTVVGQTNVFTVGADGKGSQTLTALDGSCTAKMNATIVVADGKLTSTVTSVDCTPAACSLSYTVSVPGLGNYPQTASCPGDFGGGIQSEFTLDGQTLTTSFGSAGVSCENKFVKQ